MKKLLNLLKDRGKSQSGISVITLVITIIVVIIIVALVITSNLGTIDESAVADFKHELKNVEVSVSATRISNQRQGIGEEFKEVGFYPIIIENPPEKFVSFTGAEDVGYESGEFYGYIVDLDYAKEESTKKGDDYKKYVEFEADKTITFGKDGKDNDVYIYDATGKVYYAKGFYVEGGVYYSDEFIKTGPVVTINKQYNATENIVKLVITIEEEEEVKKADEKEGLVRDYVVRINGDAAIKQDDGSYEYTITENGVYIVTAEDTSGRVSTKRVRVSEIEAKTYIITYNLMYGGLTEMQEKQGYDPVRLLRLTREGYILAGWSKNYLAQEVDYRPGGLFAENADTTLYAVWVEGEAREFTITFNANGGEGAPESIVKKEREAIQIPSDIPTREGYAFLGWSKSTTDEENLYNPGAEFVDDEDCILFAMWEEGEIRVDIAINPPEAGAAVGAGVTNVGDMVYITAVANSGYAFKKWTVQPTSMSVKVEDVYLEKTRFKMPNGTVSLVANFEATEYDYAIKYNGNNGTGVPNTQYKKHDEDIYLSTMTPTRSGYAFQGWTDTLSSKTPKYLPGALYSENKNVTLYAVWEKNTEEFTLTFDANGGENAPASITKPKDTEIYIPLTEPTRSNLQFLGWSEDKNADEPSYKKNDSYVISEDKTLYAIWLDSEDAHVNITATEENGNLVLFGNATDNGGIVRYAWTNDAYVNTNQIPWLSLNSESKEISIKKEVIGSGIHYFYVEDIDGNVSSASIDVFRMDFKAQGITVDVKYKAAGYDASLSSVIPDRAYYAFSKWQSETDGRIYESGDKYLLDAHESFEATWVKALAYIPSTDKYYATTQNAVNTIATTVTDYVLIQLLDTEITNGVVLKEGQKVSLDTGAYTLNSSNTTMNVPAGASFKLIDGTIKSDSYAIRNFGTLEVNGGKIEGVYGIYNSGHAVIGNESEAFARDNVEIVASSASYVNASGTATVDFMNGSFKDNRNTETGALYQVPTGGMTLRDGYEIRKIGTTSSDTMVTTLVEDLIMTAERTAGTTERPVEYKVTLSCSNTNYTFQYSTDNTNWTTGTVLEEIIDNCTVYGRILEGSDVANTEQITISDIVDLIITYDGGGQITAPASTTVKYKRAYGSAVPATTDTDKYNFKGWWTEATGGTEVTSDTTVSIAEDHTLYAHWKGVPVQVSFDARNNGTTLVANPSDITVYYSETYGSELPTIDDSSLTYYFRGWWTEATGGTQVTSSTQVTTTEAHTLYAHWQVKNRAPTSATVTYVEGSKTTNSLSFELKGNDPDGGQVYYDVYLGGSLKKTITTTSGKVETYTPTGLSEYTTYSCYMIVRDALDETVTSNTDSERTKCSGTTYTCTSNCTDGEEECCETKCEDCGHSTHTSNCTVYLYDCTWEYCVNGVIECSQGYEERDSESKTCTNCSQTYTRLELWCYDCLAYSYKYTTGCDCDAHPQGSIDENHYPDDCGVCDGDGTIECNCNHNSHGQDVTCTHGYQYDHYYCNKHEEVIKYLSSSSKPHCAHGETSEHE